MQKCILHVFVDIQAKRRLDASFSDTGSAKCCASAYRLESSSGCAPLTWFGLVLSGLKYLYHISASGNCSTFLGFSIITQSVHNTSPFSRIPLTHGNVLHWIYLVFLSPLRQGIKICNTLFVDAHVRKWNRFFVDPMHSDQVEVAAALDRLH